MSALFSAEAKARLGALSGLGPRFLDFVERHPEALARRSFAALQADDGISDQNLQPWPTFVGRGWVEALERASVGILSLLLELPRRVFGHDAGRIASYYGLDPAAAESLARALERRDLLGAAVARGDFVSTRSGLKCLEFNLGGNLAGWETGLWEERYRRVPLLAAFLAETGARATSRPTLRRFFAHVLATLQADQAPGAAAGTGAGAALNLAVLTPPWFQGASAMERFLTAEYRDMGAAATPPASGRVILCDYLDLAVREGLLGFGRQRIHGVVEQYFADFSPEVRRVWALGGARFWNGPPRSILEDKRNLALLSEREDSDLFLPAERALIRAHVPWTRRVEAAPVRFRGEEVFLPALLLEQREEMVLKPADRYGGTDVHLGRGTAPERWADLVRQAVGEGRWVAQERVESLPYTYQAGEDGWADYDVIWGLFVFGGAYQGGFLRMLPQAERRVVNATRGAFEGILFEVED
jgi:hypothetical protein